MKGVRFIRCYGAKFSPEDFKGKGLRGWWIRVLNSLRFYLECRVIYHVLRFQSEKFGDLVDRNAVMQMYEDDVQATKTHIKQERPRQTSATNASVEGHIKEMHRQGAHESPREQTARILERYAADPRSRRYASARGRYVIQEAESTVTAHAAEVSSEKESQHVRTESERKGRILPINDALAAELNKSQIDYARAAERLQSAEQIRLSAEAAEEHQRSVLSGDDGRTH